MPLRDHDVENDRFELDDNTSIYRFPCGCCAYRNCDSFEDPCASCDHLKVKAG